MLVLLRYSRFAGYVISVYPSCCFRSFSFITRKRLASFFKTVLYPMDWHRTRDKCFSDFTWSALQCDLTQIRFTRLLKEVSEDEESRIFHAGALIMCGTR